MYAVGSLISGNSAARSAIFFYALLLHAAIFLILARCGAEWRGARRRGRTTASCPDALAHLQPAGWLSPTTATMNQYQILCRRTSHHHVEHLESLEEECMRLQHGHLAAATTNAAAEAAGGGGVGAAGGVAEAAAQAAAGAAQQVGAAVLRLLRRT